MAYNDFAEGAYMCMAFSCHEMSVEYYGNGLKMVKHIMNDSNKKEYSIKNLSLRFCHLNTCIQNFFTP